MTHTSDLISRLLAIGQRARDLGELIRETCGVLREAGLPVDRCWVGTTVLHPQTAATSIRWTADAPQDTHVVQPGREAFARLRAVPGPRRSGLRPPRTARCRWRAISRPKVMPTTSRCRSASLVQRLISGILVTRDSPRR